MKTHRFTVFTADADEIIEEEYRVANNTEERKRRFTWRLRFGKRIDGANIKMSIESIHCRDTDILIEQDQENTHGAGTGNASQTQKTVMLGNTDEKELYTIRCPNVSSSYYYDSRNKDHFGSAPIIYLGKLNFQNTNPKDSFCHHINPDIMNSDFTLIFDENFKTLGVGNTDKRGIKDTLEIGITFILYEDKDEY